MPTFKTLQAVYDVVDKPDNLPRYLLTQAEWFQQIRDQAIASGDSATTDRAQFEMDALNLMLQNGELQPMSTGTTEDGQRIAIPDIDKFDSAMLEYIVTRFEQSESPALRSRYAHILWSSPKKHGKFADVAIQEYLQLAGMHEKQDVVAPTEHHGLDVIDSVKAALTIALQSKSTYLDSVVAEIRRLILHFSETSSSSFALRLNLIDVALQYPKLFRDKYEEFLSFIMRYVENLGQDGHRIVETMRTAEKLAAALGKDTKGILERQAAAWELLASQREPGDMAKEHFGMRALALYKRIGNETKVKEWDTTLARYRTETKLSKFETKIDITDIVKEYEKVAEEVYAWNTERILEWLVVSPDLLPDPDYIAEKAEEYGKGAIHHLFPIAPLDKHGHTFAHYDTEEEKKRFRFLEHYSRMFQWFYATRHQIVFRKVLVPEKITCEILFDFMKRRVWYAGEIERTYSGGKIVKTNWLDQLRPGLMHYFNGLIKVAQGESAAADFMLFIDSVSTKIEGIVRDIAAMNGLRTASNESDRRKRATTRLRYIHEFLWDKDFAALVSADTLEFLRWLLIEQGCMNLRNSVCHADMDLSTYSEIAAHWLFLALLRLARIEFPQPEPKP